MIAGPNNAVIKGGVTARTFMDCMAAMPWAAGNRASAGITNDEKAKKTPATRPHPMAAARIAK
jgi:hypothetical protein